METFLDLITAVQDDVNAGSESTFYHPTLIKRTINRAYRKVAGLFPWPELQDAKKTSTQANQEYYDYPQNWRSNSVWKVEIDGVRYGEPPDGSPLSFDDYLNWQEDNPDSTEKKWANQWRRFFVSPIPTALGNNNLHIWGIKTISSLEEDADNTIFSFSTPEANEAIELETVAILLSKGKDDKGAQFKSAEAKQILIGAWSKISKEMAKYEKNMPFFDVPDFFGNGNSKDLRGRFDI